MVPGTVGGLVASAEVLSAPLHGNCPRGWWLGRDKAWEGAENASLQTGGCISHCHLSPGLRPAPAPFSFPMLSVFDVRELRRAQPALDTVTHPRKPFVLCPGTEVEMGRSFNPFFFLEAGGLEPIEEGLRKKRETDSRGW